MKEPRWINWAIIFLTSVILLLIASGAAVAQPQITLKPGTWQAVEFTNADNQPENLEVTNISAPPELLPYVLVNPTVIPPLSTENVIVQLAYIPVAVRQAIPKDMFAVHINGLLVYLDLTTPLPKNAENRWAEIEADIDALRAWMEEQVDDFIFRIATLESAPKENLSPIIENLRENLQELIDARVDGLRAWAESTFISENPDVEWEQALAEYDAEIRLEFSNHIADLFIDEQFADLKSRLNFHEMITYAALIAAVVAITIAIKRPRFRRRGLGGSGSLGGGAILEVSLEDKAAMLENEIGSMRERGESPELIRQKEVELAALKAKIVPTPKPPKKRGRKGDV